MHWLVIGAIGYAQPTKVARNPRRRVAAVELHLGSGEPAQLGDRVAIRFLAKRLDGKIVADSARRGMNFWFVVGQDGPSPLPSSAALGMRVGASRTARVDLDTVVEFTLVRLVRPRSKPPRERP